MLQASPPRLDPAWVYLFDAAETVFVDGREVSPTLVFINQGRNVWSQEFLGTLLLVDSTRVQELLDVAYERSIPIVALPKSEFFRRLKAQTNLAHATN